MNGFDEGPFSVFEGPDITQQTVAEVPQAFNDVQFGSVQNGGEINLAPDDPSYWMSQSAIERGGSPSGLVENASSSDAQVKAISNGFMDAASKILAQLRGNSGQDRSVASGRARPQRTVADLLGLSGAAGNVNPQAPGSQGIWILLVVIGGFIALMMLAGSQR